MIYRALCPMSIQSMGNSYNYLYFKRGLMNYEMINDLHISKFL